MGFRLAKISDLDTIVEILKDVIKNKHEGSNWDESYPNRELLENDILKKEMFVFEDNDIINGVIVLNREQDSNYSTIDWEENDNPLIVHRLFVSPKVRGKSIGKELLLNANNFAKNNGYKSIRLDTFINNIIAQKLYENIGFINKGIIKLEGNDDEFIVYEKIL